MTATTISARTARSTKNQMLFRTINERLQDLNAAFDGVLPTGDWVCECANDACAARIHPTAEEYEHIRQHGARFPITPNESHLFVDVEIVVERTDRYWVVERQGDCAEIAWAGDPSRRD